MLLLERATKFLLLRISIKTKRILIRKQLTTIGVGRLLYATESTKAKSASEALEVQNCRCAHITSSTCREGVDYVV